MFSKLRGGSFALTPEILDDTLKAVDALSAEASYKFTPMLMLTTEAGTDKKQEGKAAGATGWIVKPFNPEQLIATIKKVLG